MLKFKVLNSLADGFEGDMPGNVNSNKRAYFKQS